jgi:glyoxylase-like metal-dependent hydrolase (beta-lactamase superfamily II)
MTHVDYDHIGGLMKWLSDEQQPFNIETLLYINTPQLLITTDSTDQVAVEHGVDSKSSLKVEELFPILYLCK